MPAFAIKHAGDAAERDDGIRVLVERRWPPGHGRESLSLDLWLREAGPSEALRRAYVGGSVPWEEFVVRYRAELARQEDVLRLLRDLGGRATVTLLHGGSDMERNHAVALKGFLHEAR